MKRTDPRLMQLGIRWAKVLVLCADDLGLPGCSVKKRVIAREIAGKMGWPYSNPDEILLRRAAELLPYAKPKVQRPRKQRAKHKPILRLVPSSATITPIPKPGAPHPNYVKDDDFYKSREWRQLRYLALRNSNGCQCCGAQAKDGVLLHVDHVKPRYKFPQLALCLDNLQVLCEDCNLGKGAWDETDWRAKMGAQP